MSLGVPGVGAAGKIVGGAPGEGKAEGRRMLLEAIGAVPQVPTQWSGGAAAYAVTAGETSRRLSRNERYRDGIKMDCTSGKSSTAPYYAGFRWDKVVRGMAEGCGVHV